MKRLFLILFSCVIAYSAMAEDLTEYGYVFPEFTQGTVRQKSGAPVNAKLNYDRIGQQMQYMDGEDVYTLLPGDVVVVVINKRRFVPASASTNIFYEEIPVENGSYYVQRKLNIVQAPKDAGYGGTSQTTSISKANNFTSGGMTYQMNDSQRRDAKDASLYYMEVNGKYRVVNMKNLTSAFKSHKAEIEKYTADNKTDFGKEADVAAVVNYALGLK